MDHKASETLVRKTEIVLPSHTNALGTIFGGTLVAWADIAAAIAAQKHARGAVVTALPICTYVVQDGKLNGEHFTYAAPEMD